MTTDKSQMTKIMIIDTQGPDGISDAYRNLLPTCSIRGHQQPIVAGTPCHPHGLMCGHLAGLIQQDQTELIFVRIFDADAKAIPGAADWALDMIRLERPDVISRSWGAWDKDTDIGDMTGRIGWKKWAEQYAKLQMNIGFVDFAAAGNNDNNDPDPDVDYPHCLLPTTNIIGSCQRNGVPSVFSGDGPGVQCVAWAERIYLCNNGKFEIGSGTSFAAPKMAGLCALRKADQPEWARLVHAKATRPISSTLEHSVKWGFGCMEDLYQAALADIPTCFLPPTVTGVGRSATRPAVWHDTQKMEH